MQPPMAFEVLLGMIKLHQFVAQGILEEGRIAMVFPLDANDDRFGRLGGQEMVQNGQDFLELDHLRLDAMIGC